MKILKWATLLLTLFIVDVAISTPIADASGRPPGYKSRKSKKKKSSNRHSSETGGSQVANMTDQRVLIDWPNRKIEICNYTSHNQKIARLVELKNDRYAVTGTRIIKQNHCGKITGLAFYFFQSKFITVRGFDSKKVVKACAPDGYKKKFTYSGSLHQLSNQKICAKRKGGQRLNLFLVPKGKNSTLTLRDRKKK